MNPAKKRQQLQNRIRQEKHRKIDLGGAGSEILAHELKAAIVLFFSILDEKQRRLYAGLESLKFGYGGDKKIADLLGVDPHTVANGRREILNQDIQVEKVRNVGGGRHSVKKNT